MENATKALLIAASVLIVILLIAMGVRIFNSTSGTAEQVDGVMQTTEITMFNNKFMPYLGANKTKTEVQSLLNLIIVNNSTSNYKIEVKLGAGPSTSYTDDIRTLQNMLEDISNNTKTSYNVNNIGTSENFKNKQGRIFRIQIY